MKTTFARPNAKSLLGDMVWAIRDGRRQPYRELTPEAAHWAEEMGIRVDLIPRSKLIASSRLDAAHGPSSGAGVTVNIDSQIRDLCDLLLQAADEIDRLTAGDLEAIRRVALLRYRILQAVEEEGSRR